jgi:hypothetical protein
MLAFNVVSRTFEAQKCPAGLISSSGAHAASVCPMVRANPKSLGCLPGMNAIRRPAWPREAFSSAYQSVRRGAIHARKHETTCSNCLWVPKATFGRLPSAKHRHAYEIPQSPPLAVHSVQRSASFSDPAARCAGIIDPSEAQPGHSVWPVERIHALRARSTSAADAQSSVLGRSASPATVSATLPSAEWQTAQ